MANLVDNAIQKLFKDGCKIVKLWENASPTSSFLGQTITIPSVRSYDYLLVEARATLNDGTIYFQALARTSGENGRLITGIDTGLGAVIKFVVREFYVGTINPVVRFYDCNFKPTTSIGEVYNIGAVPVLIRGIKLLGGVIHKLKSLAASPLCRKEVLACQW